MNIFQKGIFGLAGLVMLAGCNGSTEGEVIQGHDVFTGKPYGDVTGYELRGVENDLYAVPNSSDFTIKVGDCIKIKKTSFLGTVHTAHNTFYRDGELVSNYGKGVHLIEEFEFLERERDHDSFLDQIE